MNTIDKNNDEFVAVAKLSDVPVGGGKTLKKCGKQIALIRVDEGCVYAIDNRCPHEGYPLADGTIKDGVLTCDWHNWKFDLKSGACLRGGEDVRAYPLCVKDGEILLDLRDKDKEALLPRALSSFDEAVEERDLGRVSRDVIRLFDLGKNPDELITRAAKYAVQRLEWGWDHGQTAAFECMQIMDLYKGHRRTIPVTQAVAAVTDRALRRPVRKAPEPLKEPPRNLEEARIAFDEALEGEEQERAEAIFIEALALGITLNEARKWLFSAATAHFLSYGHGLIFTVRAFQMLERIGWQYAADFLPGLVFQIAWGTREDRLPYMRKFRLKLAKVLPELERLFEKQKNASKEGIWEGEDALFDRIVGDSMEQGFEGVLAALENGIHFDRIVSVISQAASERLLRFDPRIDKNPYREEGWLDVTHLLTYANAVREAYAAEPCAEMIRGLFMAAWFVHYVHHLDAPPELRFKYEPLGKGFGGEHLMDGLKIALEERYAQAAVAYAEAYLEGGNDIGALRAMLLRYAVEDSAAVDIVLAHHIKTMAAAFAESAAMAGPGPKRRFWPVLSAVRFMASPKVERFLMKNALLAIKLASD